MNILRKYFSYSEIDRFMLQSSLFNPKSRPEALIIELQTKQGYGKLENYLRSSLSVQQQVKLTALLATLLTKSSKLYEIVQDYLQEKQESNEWLISRIIIPFKKVLRKCSSTPQRFEDTKKRQFKKQLFVQNLTYPITLLQQMILFGKQLAKLGRYYSNSNRPDHQIYQFLGQTYVVFVDHLYGSLKFTLQSYLYIMSKRVDFTDFLQKQNILKWVMVQVIPSLNEALLEINTIKYFSFVEKGFIIKLFTIEEQSRAVQQFIKQHILQQNVEESSLQSVKTCRRKQKNMADNLLPIFQSKLIKNVSQFSTDSSNKSSLTDRQNIQQPEMLN